MFSAIFGFLLILAIVDLHAADEGQPHRILNWDDPPSSDGQWDEPSVKELLKRYQSKLLRRRNKMTTSPWVWIGSSAPDDDLHEQETQDPANLQENSTLVEAVKRGHENRRLARSRNESLADEICTTKRYWKQINTTHDYYGHKVEIVHTEQVRQFVYVFECTGEDTECSGVSQQLQSRCVTRTGWVNMLHRKTLPESSAPQWGYVSVPHHCACRISPRVAPLV